MSTYGNQHIPLSLRALRSGFKMIGTVAPRTAGRLAYSLFQTPLKRTPPKTKHRLMQQAQREMLPFGNGRLATYRWANDGPTVLLVHGWESNASRWLPLIPKLLQAGLAVVAFDAPAHGESSGRQLPFNVYGEAIETVSRRYGPLKALIAHSFGVVGSTFYLSQTPSQPPERLVYACGPNRALDVLEGFSQIINLPPKSLPHTLDALQAHAGMPLPEISVAQMMKNMPIPGLIVHDTEDRIVPYSTSQALAAGWPQAELVTTSGLGHRRILRDEKVLERISNFVVNEQ